MLNVDNIYVINMHNSTDRLEKIKSQFLNLDINFKRIDAIVGKELSQNDITKYTTKKCEYFCTPSMIGCFLSHKKAWETMIKNNDKYAIIMEDDCILAEDFSNKVNNIMNELNNDYKDWDFVYLGYVSDHIFTNFQKIIIPKIKKKKIKSTQLSIPELPLGFHCYMITNSCAKKLLKYLDKVDYHVDVSFLYNSKNFNIYSSNIPLAYQYASASNSTQTNYTFPKSLNYMLEIYDKNNIAYSYYFNTPLFRFMTIDVNVYLLIFLIILFFTPANRIKSIYSILLSFLVFESLIGFDNFNIISKWVFIFLIFYIIKSKKN